MGFDPSAVRCGSDRFLCCLIVGIHASGISSLRPIPAFSKIQSIINALSDWLSYYWAICYSPLVVKAPAFWRQKKGFKSSFNQIKLFCLDIFDELVGFY